MNTTALLMTLMLSLLAAPHAAQAQQPEKMPLVGVLRPGAAVDPLIDAFRQGLRDLGYVEGHNLRMAYRFAEGREDRLPVLAAELVQLPVDVLVAGGVAAIQAAQHATRTIPIVMTVAADPVALGFIASLARPGGNVTGLSSMGVALATKQLELLTEAGPGRRRLAVLWNPDRLAHTIELKELHAVSARVGIDLEGLDIRSPEAFDWAFLTMRDKGVGAAIVLDDVLFFHERTRLAALAAKSQMPVMYGNRGFVEAGGLLSYGANFSDLFRRAATYVDKILKGATPADLPVEQTIKFELVINLKTAQTLGLTIPPSLLFQAKEVIR